MVYFSKCLSTGLGTAGGSGEEETEGLALEVFTALVGRPTKLKTQLQPRGPKESRRLCLQSCRLC